MREEVIAFRDMGRRNCGLKLAKIEDYLRVISDSLSPFSSSIPTRSTLVRCISPTTSNNHVIMNGSKKGAAD